uniref:Uncharacterized protein n=1 Tax=Anguilla anguilla TaxID=7936 RepID=A0A0E9UW63_ANGAN
MQRKRENSATCSKRIRKKRGKRRNYNTDFRRESNTLRF